MLARALAALAVLGAAHDATADDRITVGYNASRPITANDSGLAHSLTGRWDRRVISVLEIGFGLQLGLSAGEESVDRLALLPGLAIVERVGNLTYRIEQQIGWQIVHGKITLDGIPLQGTETRGFHSESAIAVDASLAEKVELRARIGLAIDGLFPVGHSSLRVGPFVGVAAVFGL